MKLYIAFKYQTQYLFGRYFRYSSDHYFSNSKIHYTLSELINVLKIYFSLNKLKMFQYNNFFVKAILLTTHSVLYLLFKCLIFNDKRYSFYIPKQNNFLYIVY